METRLTRCPLYYSKPSLKRMYLPPDCTLLLAKSVLFARLKSAVMLIPSKVRFICLMSLLGRKCLQGTFQMVWLYKFSRKINNKVGMHYLLIVLIAELIRCPFVIIPSSHPPSPRVSRLFPTKKRRAY